MDPAPPVADRYREVHGLPVHSDYQTVLDDPAVEAVILTIPHRLHEEALLRIYPRLRPGNPPQLEKAKTLFQEKFYDVNRYRLGRVGRFRINRKLSLSVSDKEMTLRPEDRSSR